jgi:hypothetical protein
MVDGAGANLMARRPAQSFSRANLLILAPIDQRNNHAMQPLGNKVEAFYKLRSDGDAAANPHARLASIFTLFGFCSRSVGLLVLPCGCPCRFVHAQLSHWPRTQQHYS